MSRYRNRVTNKAPAVQQQQGAVLVLDSAEQLPLSQIVLCTISAVLAEAADLSASARIPLTDVSLADAQRFLNFLEATQVKGCVRNVMVPCMSKC